MKSINDNLLAKGVYDHFQVGGYFTVKEYIIVKQDGKRCLLLRFKNEMKTNVNTVEFTVKQLDSKNKQIHSATIKYDGLNIRSRAYYSAEQGIVLDDACENFIVQMRYVISDKVKYVFKKGLVTAHYDARGYVVPKPSFKRECKVSLKSRSAKLGRGYGWVALLSFVLLVIAVVILIYRGNNSYKNKNYSDLNTVTVSQQYSNRNDKNQSRS